MVLACTLAQLMALGVPGRRSALELRPPHLPLMVQGSCSSYTRHWGCSHCARLASSVLGDFWSWVVASALALNGLGVPQ